MEAIEVESKGEVNGTSSKRAIVDLTEESQDRALNASQENCWKPFYLTSVAGLPPEYNGLFGQLVDTCASNSIILRFSCPPM